MHIKTFIACFVTLSLLPSAVAFAHDEYHRYQAVPLTGNTVFIMDTKDGHMWLWLNRPGQAITQENPSVEYQGNVQNHTQLAPPLQGSEQGYAPLPQVAPEGSYTGNARY